MKWSSLFQEQQSTHSLVKRWDELQKDESALAHAQSLKQVRRWQRRVYWVVLLVGIIVSCCLFSAQQRVHPVLTGGGRGGVDAVPQQATPGLVCGNPTLVFEQFGFVAADVPPKSVLENLPTPQQATAKKGIATYDPTHNLLCAVDAQDLAPLVLSTGTNVAGGASSSTGSQWVQDILSGLLSTAQQGLRDFLDGIVSWAVSFGFVFLTPPGLTYGQPVVDHLNSWVVGLLDSFLVLILVVGGYQVMLGRGHLLRELAPRMVIAGVLGSFSLFILSQFIDLESTLSSGVQLTLATVGVGDLSLPLGIINWASAPEYEVLTYLIDLVMSMLLCIQMIVRIGMLDFLLVVAPLGFACFILPQTAAWGRLWAQAFVSTLIVQFLQMICLGLGTTLITSFGHATQTPISLLVGIATLSITFRLPGMLLSNVLRATTGGSGSSAGGSINTVLEIAALVAA